MAEPMTPEALEAIRARLARVAPSLPWASVPDRAHHGLVRDITGEAVADVYCGDRVHAPVIADFIANAPADLAALLAEVERLRAAAPKKAPWVTPDGCDHDGAPEVAPLDDCVRCGGTGLLAPEVVCCCACSECRAEYDNA